MGVFQEKKMIIIFIIYFNTHNHLQMHADDPNNNFHLYSQILLPSSYNSCSMVLFRFIVAAFKLLQDFFSFIKLYVTLYVRKRSPFSSLMLFHNLFLPRSCSRQQRSPSRREECCQIREMFLKHKLCSLDIKYSSSSLRDECCQIREIFLMLSYC